MVYFLDRIQNFTAKSLYSTSARLIITTHRSFRRGPKVLKVFLHRLFLLLIFLLVPRRRSHEQHASEESQYCEVPKDVATDTIEGGNQGTAVGFFKVAHE